MQLFENSAWRSCFWWIPLTGNWPCGASQDWSNCVQPSSKGTSLIKCTTCILSFDMWGPLIMKAYCTKPFFVDHLLKSFMRGWMVQSSLCHFKHPERGGTREGCWMIRSAFKYPFARVRDIVFSSLTQVWSQRFTILETLGNLFCYSLAIKGQRLYLRAFKMNWKLYFCWSDPFCASIRLKKEGFWWNTLKILVSDENICTQSESEGI